MVDLILNLPFFLFFLFFIEYYARILAANLPWHTDVLTYGSCWPLQIVKVLVAANVVVGKCSCQVLYATGSGHIQGTLKV